MLLTNKNYGEKAQEKFTAVAHYQNYVIAIDEENIEAKKMAVAAIRKQIPQRPVDKKASEEFNRPAYQARKLIRTQGEYLQEDPNE